MCGDVLRYCLLGPVPTHCLRVIRALYEELVEICHCIVLTPHLLHLKTMCRKAAQVCSCMCPSHKRLILEAPL